ncbi:MAG TPA: ribosome biogenesis GTP-binding protein YihA/YsxC [Bacteroidia bacterium]|nr:ribosome biogenesis GTP-binding protein YihA/YsxC [Bacteroidia bacterium]
MSKSPQSIIIRSATFVQSNTNPNNCPKPDRPEFAFIGRSNVGKSSLINMLTNHKGLAKTSSTPGKTQVINHFNINEAWYLVDLPGYGFAKISREKREQWEKMIQSYLLKRENLISTFVLIDSRIDPQVSDLTFMRWMGESGLPFAIVFTKSDKLTKNNLTSNIEKYKNTLLEEWETVPDYFISSSDTGTGRNEILAYIETHSVHFK